MSLDLIFNEIFWSIDISKNFIGHYRQAKRTDERIIKRSKNLNEYVSNLGKYFVHNLRNEFMRKFLYILIQKYPKIRLSELWEIMVREENNAFELAKINAYKFCIPSVMDDPKFVEIYTQRTLAILSNIDNNSLTCRKYGIIENIDKIGSKTPREITKKAFRKEILLSEFRNKQKVEHKYSSIYVCPYCKEKKTNSIDVQTSAGDECQNTYCICANCGKTFRAK